MHDMEPYTLSMQAASNVHQTTGIAGDERISAGALEARDLLLQHRVRDLWIFDRKGPAKTTALFLQIHVHGFSSPNLGEQSPGFLFDP